MGPVISSYKTWKKKLLYFFVYMALDNLTNLFFTKTLNMINDTLILGYLHKQRIHGVGISMICNMEGKIVVIIHISGTKDIFNILCSPRK